MYRNAAMTGLRQGELMALRWRDVDWQAQRIRVRQNWVLGEFGTPKSKRSTRSVPMADEVAGELDRLFKQSRWKADHDLVFAAPHTEEPPYKPGILKRYRKALKAAQLDETHVSTTYATRSGRGWPRPAYRCGRCRNGWGTATSARRSGLRTTRRAATRRRWSRPRSPVGPFVGPTRANLR
jgi:integrase